MRTTFRLAFASAYPHDRTLSDTRDIMKMMVKEPLDAKPDKPLVAFKYRFHWHVILSHFPMSFFIVSAMFVVPPLLGHPSSFQLAAYVSLVAGTVMMFPTTITGWRTWKGHYRGARGMIFRCKRRIAYAMLGLSVSLVVLGSFLVPGRRDALFFVYAAGMFALLLGSVAEGFYGERLNHH